MPDGARQDISRIVAETVRASRLRAGLSQAALARRAGVPRTVVRAVEAGEDPRRSTLVALLETLDIDACEILQPAFPCRPPDRVADWSRAVELHGLLAECLEHEVTLGPGGKVRRTTTVTGARFADGRAHDDAALVDLARSVSRGSSRLLAELAGKPPRPDGRWRELRDAGNVHAFRASRQPGRWGLTYRRDEMSRVPDGASRDVVHAASRVDVEYPVRRLVIRLGGPADVIAPPAPHIVSWWRAMGTLDETSPPATCAVEDAALREERVGGTIFVIDAPWTGLTHAASWSGTSPTAGIARSAALPRLVRLAREAVGLSLRELARRMGVSSMTVKGLEEGRDPRVSTLACLLRALPGLTPWDILPLRSNRPSDPWLRARVMAPCVSDSETKSVRITPSGDARLTIRTERLRREDGRDEDLVLGLGLRRAVIQESRARLAAVEGGDERVLAALRIVRRDPRFEPPLHLLRVPRDLAHHGVSFERRLHHAGVHALTAERALERTGRRGPYREGVSFAAQIPTDVLRLVVVFPRGAFPEDVRAHAWSLFAVPQPDGPDLGERLRDEIELSVERGRRRIELVTRRPPPDVKLALTWQLPAE